MSKTTEQDNLMVGSVQVDITPKSETHLCGALDVYRAGKEVLDSLYAKVLILRNKDRKICFVSLDLTLVSREYADKIKDAAVDMYDFCRDAVMIHATHTHSAPSLGLVMVDRDFDGIPKGSEWLGGCDSNYCSYVVECVIKAIEQAHDILKPVQVGFGSGIEGRMAHNRRAVMRDGSIGMPWKGWQGGSVGPTNIRYIEGPIDPEVGVMCFRTNALKINSIVVNYACHPVHVYPKDLISADWPGALADKMQNKFDDAITVVFNGASGNINPWPAFDPQYVESHEHMGKVLAQKAVNIIKGVDFKGDVVIDWRVKNLNIPIREIDSEDFDKAKKMLKKHPKPVWENEEKTKVSMDWIIAASIMSVHLQKQRSDYLDYQIQVFRVGEAVFVGLPGEPFVEGQLQIKLNSPTPFTYIVENINQYVGYIPTKQLFGRYKKGKGGHELETRYWAKLVPEALDMIVDASSEMIKEMF